MNQEIETNLHETTIHETEASKRPMTGAERVAKMREKDRLLKEGKYVATPLEHAKQRMIEMHDPHLGKLEEDAGFFKTLSEDDLVKLRVFVKNLKAKATKTRVMLS
jgi:hypothetical protein